MSKKLDEIISDLTFKNEQRVTIDKTILIQQLKEAYIAGRDEHLFEVSRAAYVEGHLDINVPQSDHIAFLEALNDNHKAWFELYSKRFLAK